MLAAKLAADTFALTRQNREYGWCGPWGDVKDTHNTGSPRNALCSEGVVLLQQARGLMAGVG